MNLFLLDDDPPPAPPIVVLPRLVTDGHVFTLETGELWTAVECSDFNLFGRFVKGEDITPVLAQRAAFGFNLLRVWTRYSGNATFEAEIGRLLPSEHPDLYLKLPDFCQLLARHGLYVEFTAYTGGSRETHWEALGSALQGQTNVLVELINEANAYAHDIHVQDFSPLPGLICSHGSNGSESIPVRPWWQYEAFHTNQAFEWWRKGGHNGMELSHGDAEGHIEPSRVPVIANENTRPDHDGTLIHHEDAAAGCALLIAGSCFHSASGKKSVLFTDFDRPFAEAFVRGARSVDLACQAGPYRRLDPGDALRVYQRPVEGHACVVRIRH